MPNCVVVGCGTRSGGGVPLFLIPTAEPIKTAWQDFAQGGRLVSRQKLKAGCKICALHFHENDFENLTAVKMGFSKKLQLKKGSLPTLRPAGKVDEGESVQLIISYGDSYETAGTSFTGVNVETTSHGVLKDEEVEFVTEAVSFKDRGCSRTFKAGGVPFHRFPTAPDRRARWVQEIRRVDRNKKKREPGKHSWICGSHFVEGRKSNDPLHIDFVPTVFCFSSTKAGKRDKPVKRYKRRNSKRAAEDNSVDEDRAVWRTTDHDYIKTMTRPNLYKYRTPVDMKPLNIVEEVRMSRNDEPNHGAYRQFSEREPEESLFDVQMNNASTIGVAAITKTEPHDEDSTPFPAPGSQMQNNEEADPSAGAVVRIERMDAHTHPTVKTEPCDEQTDSALCDEDGYLAEESTGTSSYLASLAQSMYQMQKDGTFCDLVLCISDGDGIPNDLNSVKVHRNVFSAVSGTIRNLHGSILRLNEDVSIDHIHKVVEYVYTGKISNLGELAPQDITRISYAAYVLDVRKCVEYIRFERLKRGSLAANGRSQDRRFQIRDSSPDACGASATPPDIDDYLPLPVDMCPVEIWERPTSADEDVDVLLQQQLLDSTDTSEGEMVEQSYRPKSRKRKKRHNLVEFSQEIPLYATQNKGQGIKTGPRKTFSGHKIDFRTKSQKTLHRAVS